MLIREDGKYDKSTIEKLILETVKEEELKSVKDLVAYLKKAYDLPKRTILNLVTRMEEDGKLTLHKRIIQGVEEPVISTQRPQTFIGYLQSPQATDLWVTLTLALAAIIAILLIPEDLYPVVFLRWILGASFVLFLPGYALKTAIFTQRELDSVEVIAVSFGLSLAVAPLVGLTLNFTPWGITLTHVLMCLALITAISIAIGAYRKAKTTKANE